ncbi:MAG: HEAT repeat domain-containing protein [Pseudomonadota bacterium]
MTAPLVSRHLKMDIVRVCAAESISAPKLSLEQVDYATVLGLLSSENVKVRRIAVYTLGDIRDQRAVSHVSAALNDRDASTRMIAARALGKIGGFEAVPALIALLEEPCGPRCLKANAAAALGKIGDARAMRALEKVNNTEQGWVQANAETALLRIAANTSSTTKTN